MRNRTVLIAALLLASAGLAQAQVQQQPTNGQAQTQATPASSFTPAPTLGTVDFGFRSDSTKGDAARYNRFRDLREGAFLDRFRFEKETETTLFRAEANNVGYRDQRYFGEFRSIGNLKASFEWNQIPLFLGDLTRTLYTDRGNGVLDVDDAIQQAVQGGTPLSAFMDQARQYDLRSRRDLANFDLVYSFNRDVDFKFNLRNANRNGYQLVSYGLGTSPGLNPSLELSAPLDDRITDVRASVEFANQKGLLAVGYSGSWFDNKIPTIRFDNPLRATDAATGTSAGQAAWWPSNTSFSVNVNGSYKVAPRTRASAALSFGQWAQDEPLVAPTVNTALVAPVLPRATADTQADIVSMVYNLNTRPVNTVWLNARFRYYDYENKSPHFRVENAIIGDWTAGTQIHETEPASFKRQNLDLDASFTPFEYLAFGVGYGREDGERTFRIFENTAEDVIRVTADSTGNQYFSVRAKYEYSSRSGSGFEEHLLEEVDEHPEMRHFDIANRDRTRFTTMLTVTPVGLLSFNAAVGTGEDDYDETGFGLRDSTVRNWSAGFDVVPNETVNFGVNYGYDKYTAYQYSRTALPAGNANGPNEFFDERRDWWTDQNDTVKTISASLDLLKAFPKTDIRFGYDFSDGKATYIYGTRSDAPRVTVTRVESAVPVPNQLPPLKNRLTTGRVDVQYFVRANVALGVAYHYEEYKVQDFALGENTINQLYLGNTVYTNYLFRPYTAHTAWLRMTYLW